MPSRARVTMWWRGCAADGGGAAAAGAADGEAAALAVGDASNRGDEEDAGDVVGSLVVEEEDEVDVGLTSKRGGEGTVHGGVVVGVPLDVGVGEARWRDEPRHPRPEMGNGTGTVSTSRRGTMDGARGSPMLRKGN